MINLLVSQVVRRTLVLAELIADHVALVGQLGAVEGLEQKTHPVAFQPEAQFNLIAGQRLEIIRAVEVGGAIDVGRARAFQVFDVRLFADMLRPLEHHVLEEVGETGPPGFFVHGADVIPEVDGYQREAMVFIGQHLQAVRQLVLLVLDERYLQGFTGRQVGGGRKRTAKASKTPVATRENGDNFLMYTSPSI